MPERDWNELDDDAVSDIALYSTASRGVLIMVVGDVLSNLRNNQPVEREAILAFLKKQQDSAKRE